MSNDPLLDKFGELLMKRVRDKAIADWERIVGGQMKGVTAERVRQQLASFNDEEKATVLKLVPQIVDSTIHHLLFTIEQENSIEVRVSDANLPPQNVREASDGLSGEPYGNNGWIARFSSRRQA